MARQCKSCEQEIPPARLQALPSADTCVTCSTEEPVQGFMTWEHKTAPTIVIGESAVTLRKYARKGVHAQLPMASKERGAKELGGSVLTTPIPAGGKGQRSPEPLPMQAVNHPPAQCHPSRPRVTTRGHCLECAIAWYRARERTR